jgi:enoyl-CoA hydratase
MFDNLVIEREGLVAVVTISRPRVLNALDARTLDELGRASQDLTRDAGVAAVVLTGAGDTAFAAGADIAELAAMRPTDAHAHARHGQQVFDLLEHMGKPVIAAVNGFALGGGCELAMACTLRIAADTARFGQPEIGLGLIPGFAGTQRLTRLVGRGAALDMLLTGRQITAGEALRLGLVCRVVPAADLLTAARELAGTLARQPALAMRYIIEAVHFGADAAFDRAQHLEAALFGLTASTADMREGTSAFLEKRAPSFTGE